MPTKERICLNCAHCVRRESTTPWAYFCRCLQRWANEPDTYCCDLWARRGLLWYIRNLWAALRGEQTR